MNEEIEIKKGAEYLATAKALSNIIKELPLSYDDNQRLIEAILTHTEAGRKEAYTQGVTDTLTTDLAEKVKSYLGGSTNGQIYS